MQKESPFKALLDSDIQSAAYESVLSLLEQRITSVAKRRVPADAVQDVVQDTLLVLLRKLPELTSEVDILPYTYLALRNIIGNYYQEERSLKRFRDLDENELLTNSLEEIETNIYLDQVLDTCKRTNGEYARIVKMVLDGYTLKEIMKEIGAPSIEALHTKIHRGRKQLKAALRNMQEQKVV
jgi:RNA polymerase sigma factor (sigma-70 family)